MTFINPTTSAASGTQSAGTTSATSSQTADPLQSLSNPQTFLNLLVAQLKYQDPLNPTTGTQFLSQTAQLTQVETMSSLESQVSAEAQLQQTQASTSMIGQKIAATLSDGTQVSGVVDGVTLDATSGPMLNVGGTAVPLSAVQTVGVAPAPATTVTSSSSGSSGTSGA